MNIPKIKGIARCEIWISNKAKTAMKKLCERNDVSMKDYIDFLIIQDLSKNAPELLEMNEK